MSARRKRTLVRERDPSDCFEQPGLRLIRGDSRETLVDQTCDALIVDPPYSARTHDSTTTRSDGYADEGLAPTYEGWSLSDVAEFVMSWSSRVRGWIVALTDSELIPAWTAAYRAAGRYAFSPVPCVMRGMSVRIQNDGPSSWTVYAMVSRPRVKAFMDWGVLPGAYVGPSGTEAGGGRGKPPWLMSALVRDYSRAGDVVCDPVAGWGSTLTAALSLGRSAVGGERDPDAYTEAVRRLRRPLQIDLLEQGSLYV